MMSKKRRILSWLMTIALCIGLFLPPSASAIDLYFVSINDGLLPLTADTMPVWSGGVFYVPYTVFDSSANGGFNLGISCIYNRNRSTVILYNNQQVVTFNLNSGLCLDELTGTTYPNRAIMRNGRPYLSLGTVCGFFDLEYTYNLIPSISQGYLVRIKDDTVVLSDVKFIDAASDLIQRRLREYNQSLAPSSGSNTATPPQTDESDNPSSVSTYLAFRCRNAEGLSSILDTLQTHGEYGVFFVTPELMEQEDDLLRRILGSGHSVGVLAEGDSLEQTREALDRGRQCLAALTYTRTTLAWAPKEHRNALEAEGWICWSETLTLSPSDTVSGRFFATSTLRQLSGHTRTTYLTLEGGSNTARVLSTLLNQLAENHFDVSIPMETKL